MSTHALKCWPRPFGAILSGDKRCEFRRNDRGFEVGDELLLKEWSPAHKRYSHCEIRVMVTHIVRGPAFGVPDGYVVMSIQIPRT